MKTAKTVKTELMMYLTYQLHHRYAVTEGINSSDVFSINQSGYSCEYEIKISKSDLDSELKILFDKEELKRGYHRGTNKQQKHYYYQLGLPRIEEQQPDWYGGLLKFKYFVPNKYFFVVPNDLYTYLYLKIANLKYGIIVYHDSTDYWTMEVKKQADFLHKEKASDEVKIRMLDRSVNEVVHLRSQFMRDYEK